MPKIFEIEYLSGSLSGRTVQVVLDENQSLSLGRNAGSDLRMGPSDDCVSGDHARVVFEGGRLWIEDRGSVNGTYVDGRRVEKGRSLVAHGARVRLARTGPEMVFRAVGEGPSAAAGLETADAEPVGDRPVRQGGGARGGFDGRAAAVLVAALLILMAGVGAALWSRGVAEETEGVVPWRQIETVARPAVGHVRVRYHLEESGRVHGDDVTVEHSFTEVTGTAVLVAPGVAVTAKHVAEPWKYLSDWSATEYASWEEFARKTGTRAVADLRTVQFPGLQPLTATLRASAETSDLALLAVSTVGIEPLSIARDDGVVQVPDDIAVLGYPYSLGELEMVARDSSYPEMTDVEVVDMEPTFVRGAVSRRMGAGEPYFYLDASIEPGNSGGPVLGRDGRVIGILSMQLKVDEVQTFRGRELPVVQEVEAAGRAVSPGTLAEFLIRTGVF